MKKRSLIAGGVVVAALCAVILPKILKKEPFAQPVADPIVDITSPVVRDISITTELVGTVEPEDVIYIYAKAGGDVTDVAVKAGDIVEAGQLLCVIDTSQIESAKNSMESAGLALRQAQEELSRQQILYAGGGISEQAYQQYKDNVESAQISYNNAKNNYDTQVSYSQVLAPIGGKVETCDVEVFDHINQNEQLCVISGEGSRIVSFSATERIKNNLSEGDPIRVEKDGQTYAGEIFEVSSMADGTTGLFKVRARLSDEGLGDDVLPTGSRAKLEVISSDVENVLAIPVDAVYYEGGLSYVYTFDREIQALHKVEVQTGLYDAEWIEVQSGLTAEDEVVTTWSSELYEGTKVRISGETGAGSDAAPAENAVPTENAVSAENAVPEENAVDGQTTADGVRQ